MLLRVTCPEFTAEATWEAPSPGYWICVQAAPVIQWMEGMSLDVAIAFIREKGLQSQWLTTEECTTLQKPAEGSAEARRQERYRNQVMWQAESARAAKGTQWTALRDACSTNRDERERNRLLPIEAAKPQAKILDSPVFEPPRFTAQQGIFQKVVMGENAHVFRLLEQSINAMRENGSTTHLLLVGPPSVGKTTTAQIIAQNLERPILLLSGATIGSSLIDLVEGPLSRLCNGKPFSEIYRHPSNSLAVHRIAPTTLFVDEAHMIPAKLQTMLLMATEVPYILADKHGRMFDFQDVLLILGTTDPSRSGKNCGLAKPLRTRCAEIVFQAYGVDTVAQILNRQFPYLDMAEAHLLARAGKLVPRVALGYAKQAEAGRVRIGTFLRDFIGVDANGLDSLDQKILEALSLSYVQKNLLKVREAELLLEAANSGARVTPAQISKAKALLEHKGSKPLSIAALADRLQLTDEMEIKTRVHYLESIGMVERTPRGVVIKG